MQSHRGAHSGSGAAEPAFDFDSCQIDRYSFYRQAIPVKEKALFARLPEAKHRALSALAASWGITLGTLIESLIDQVLIQTVPGYDAPQWLLDAIESGLLPIQPCPDDESMESVDNVVTLGRAR